MWGSFEFAQSLPIKLTRKDFHSKMKNGWKYFQRAENGGLDSRFWGAPISVERSKTIILKGLEFLDWKSGRSKKTKSNQDRSNPPFSSLWKYVKTQCQETTLKYFKPSSTSSEFLTGTFKRFWPWFQAQPETLLQKEREIQGRVNHEVHSVNWNTGIWGWKVPNSRFALQGLTPP